MAPLNNAEMSDFRNMNRRFYNPNKELKPGGTIQVLMEDFSKNKKTKFPLAGKDYCYRVSMTNIATNEGLLWDINGFDVANQVFRILYPTGKDNSFRQVYATVTRRLERKRGQGAVEVTMDRVAETESATETGPSL